MTLDRRQFLHLAGLTTLGGATGAVGLGVGLTGSGTQSHAMTAQPIRYLRLAGWFDTANAVLIGRTAAESVEGFSQRDALLNALGDLDIPVLYDLDIGHLPPQLMLINGALASLRFGPGEWRIDQTLA